MQRQKLIHIHSNVVNNGEPKAPSASTIEYGELAINYNAEKPRIFIKKEDDEVIDYLDSRIVNILNSGSTMDTVPSAAVTYAGLAELDLKAKELEETKQDLLTAGENIIISGNVISSLGGVIPVSGWSEDPTHYEVPSEKLVYDTIIEDEKVLVVAYRKLDDKAIDTNNRLGGLTLWHGTQEEYDAIEKKDEKTFYIIIESE